MLESEKLAIAAHLHVLMRRRLGRVTDVEWMVKNADYAMEIVRIARDEAHEDLHEWADKLETAVLRGSRKEAVLQRPAPEAAESRFPLMPSRRYVGSLR